MTHCRALALATLCAQVCGQSVSFSLAYDTLGMLMAGDGTVEGAPFGSANAVAATVQEFRLSMSGGVPQLLPTSNQVRFGSSDAAGIPSNSLFHLSIPGNLADHGAASGTGCGQCNNATCPTFGCGGAPSTGGFSLAFDGVGPSAYVVTGYNMPAGTPIGVSTCQAVKDPRNVYHRVIGTVAATSGIASVRYNVSLRGLQLVEIRAAYYFGGSVDRPIPGFYMSGGRGASE
jgi:hypothetical protein